MAYVLMRDENNVGHLNIVECDPVLKVIKLLRERSKLKKGMNIIPFMIGKYEIQFCILFINIYIVITYLIS